jgi:hypothetical protein
MQLTTPFTRKPLASWVAQTTFQPTKVNFCFHEPEALADFLHFERTRLAPQAHFCRLCLHESIRSMRTPA